MFRIRPFHFCIVEDGSMMAASEKAFDDSISYGLSRIVRPELTLKPQQLEAVRHLGTRLVISLLDRKKSELGTGLVAKSMSC